jgi:hypothetical protein
MGHPGTAFMDLQFYPPGWVKQFASQSCDARNWCAALTIDGLSEDPVNGTTLNRSCQSSILGGIEYVNFAFLTHSGTPIAAPNPLQFNPATGGNLLNLLTADPRSLGSPLLQHRLRRGNRPLRLLHPRDRADWRRRLLSGCKTRQGRVPRSAACLIQTPPPRIARRPMP